MFRINFEKTRKFILSLAGLFLIMSFWVFSRFTVDDAFISWRYGKNLVDFGIWNYNPSTLDLTQAYTNPIYAALSIIPNYFSLDVVLFFKMTSLFTTLVFLYFFIRKTKMPILTIAFLSLPASIIHIFGGLETFSFVALITFLVISLYEKKFKLTLSLCIILFLIRPEAWLFLILVPGYFILNSIEINIKNGSSFIDSIFLTIKNRKVGYQTLISIIIFSVILIFYFSIHKEYFGYALPNTFYVKSGSFFNLNIFITSIFFMLPLSLILLKKNFSLFLLCFGFFSALVISYSTSDLQMNYAQRFVFHIAAPSYFISIYIISTFRGDYINFRYNDSEYFNKVSLLSTIPILFGLCLFWVSSKDAVQLANYYPRALESHAELGKAIKKINIKSAETQSFSLGDAGMAAYHSETIALDIIGLGSSLVTHNGLSKNVLLKYNPDIVAFYSTPTSGIRLSVYEQNKLFSFVKDNKYDKICDVYWLEDYTLTIYAKEIYSDIQKVCNKSKNLNNINNKDFLLSHIFKLPIKYWKE